MMPGRGPPASAAGCVPGEEPQVEGTRIHRAERRARPAPALQEAAVSLSRPQQAQHLPPRTTPGGPPPLRAESLFADRTSFCSLLYSLASGAHTGGRRCRSENTFLPPTPFSDHLAGQILAWGSFSFRTWKAVLLPPRFPCKVEKTEGVQAPNPLPVTCLSPFLRCAGSLPEPSRTADDVH